jgi:MFS family permease
LLGESFQAWLAVLVGVLAISAHSASSVVYSIVMKPMLAELGWNRTSFSSALNARMLVMIAVIPFAGLLTDRFGARFVLAGGALLVGLGSIGLAPLQTLPQLFALMALMGPGQAGMGTVAASALVLRLFRARHGMAIGILNGGDNLINSLVPLATAGALVRWGWRATLAGLGLTYVALAVLIAVALRPRAGDAANRGSGTDPATAHATPRLRDLPWTDTRLWLVFVSYACIYAFVTSLQLHFHAFQTDSGRSAADAARLLSTQILVGAAGAPLFGWLGERTSARGALVIVVLGLTATSVLMWAAQSYGIFMLWAVAYGLVNSGAVALLALVLAELFGAAQIGRLMGMAMVFCMTATMLGNFFSASTFDHFGSYRPVWQAYTTLMAVTLIPVVLLWRSARRKSAAPL